MKFKTLWKGAVLVTASAALIAAISILGIVFFVFSSSVDSRNWGVSIHEISNALIWDGESYTLTDESSSLYLPMFKDSLFFNHTVYAPYEVDDKIYQQWLAEGTDLSDESQFVLRFEPTQCYLNLCCKFSYMAFDIPVHEEDTDDKEDESKIDEAKEYERQVKENSEKQKIKRHTPERAREMLNTVKPVKKNPFAKIYTPGKPNGS